jgi:hypothetical protein
VRALAPTVLIPAVYLISLLTATLVVYFATNYHEASGFKTTQIYFLAIMDIVSLKLMCQPGCLSSRLQGTPFSWPFPAAKAPACISHLASPNPTPILSSPTTHLLPPFQKGPHHHNGSPDGSRSPPHLKTLNHMCQVLLPYEVTLTGSWGLFNFLSNPPLPLQGAHCLCTTATFYFPGSDPHF